MMLTEEHIRKNALDAKRRSEVNNNLTLMMRHQERVRFHVNHAPSSHTVENVPLAEFLRMVKQQLPEYKYEKWKSLLSYPLATVGTTSTIFSRLSRIFEGRNPVYDYQFRDPKMKDDWEWYRQDVLGGQKLWKGKAWEYFKTEPNAVMVVDLPVDGRKDMADPYVQPYVYFVCTKNIVDYKSDEDGNIEWLIYKDSEKNLMYVIDDESYQVYTYDGDAEPLSLYDKRLDGGSVLNGVLNIGDRVSVSMHNLGYCPCKFLCEESIDVHRVDVKQSPITKVLGDLDWFLFFHTSKKYLDTYAEFPIYSGYADACDFETELDVDGDKKHCHCKKGYLVDDEDMAVMMDGVPVACPMCKHEKEMAGPGTFIKIPVPNGDDIPDMRNPVQMLNVDRSSLDYTVEEESRLESTMIAKCIGIDGNAVNQFSISDKQVDANFESQSTILLRVKRTFEHLQKFADDTCCRLRYGQYFESSAINYGTEFYMLSTKELRDMYAAAKSGGASESDLGGIRRQIVQTEYRTDELQQQRMLILLDVEPLNGRTYDEVVELYDKGIVNEEDVKVKMNFDSLIRRFEREHGSLLEYGVPMLTYQEKIDSIGDILHAYVREGRSNKIGY